MSLSGARGLIRVAHNPTCELQAAMAIERVSERALYQALAGAEYPGYVCVKRNGALPHVP